MTTILHELFGGDFIPYEKMGICSPEYRAIIRKIEAERNYLAERMSEEDRVRFDKLESLFDDSGDMETQKAFCLGFKLAARIMCEVFTADPDVRGCIIE